ncbi:hypothetical protein [Marinobacter sp. MBR-105]|jgi:hypothetical protein
MPARLKQALFALYALAFVGMTLGILLFGSAGTPSADEHGLIKQLREFARP